jgi:hypothetical protein
LDSFKYLPANFELVKKRLPKFLKGIMMKDLPALIVI